MYIYICIYIYIYICIYIHICIYIYIYVYIYIYICMFIHMYTYRYTFTDTCIYINIYVYVYIYICICIYIYVHDYKCLFMCMQWGGKRMSRHPPRTSETPPQISWRNQHFSNLLPLLSVFLFNIFGFVFLDEIVFFDVYKTCISVIRCPLLSLDFV